MFNILIILHHSRYLSSIFQLHLSMFMLFCIFIFIISCIVSIFTKSKKFTSHYFGNLKYMINDHLIKK